MSAFKIIADAFYQYSNQTVDESDDVESRRKKTVLVIVPSLLIPLTIFMGAILYSVGFWAAALIPWGYSIITLFSLQYYLRSKSQSFFQNSQLILVMLLPAILMWMMGGFDTGGVMVLWSLFTPIAALILFDERRATRWFLAFLLLVIISALINEKVTYLGATFPNWVKSIFFMINIVCVCTGLFILIKNSLNAERNSNKKLVVDRDQLKIISQELSLAKDIADASNKAKSDFLASMSHEIRTPMNAIIGLTDITLRTQLSANQQDNLGKIYIAANALLQIINDILDVSKIEAGQMTVESAPFNLNQVFEDLATVLATDIETKRLELLFNIDPKVPVYLIGDSLRLGQVLLNLTGNAKKFTEEGDIVVSCSLLEQENNCAKLQFTIEDSGIGMTEDQTAKLFNAFVQADSSTSRKYGGTGLGLTICKQLVTLMNGEIWVESTLGVGSRFMFTVNLPLDPNIGANLKGKVYDTGPLGHLKILVADDNENARNIFQKYLQAFGFEVETVNNGIDALRAINKADVATPFNIALIDYRMPGMNGLEVIEKLKKNNNLHRAPKVILVSAASRTVDDEAEEKLKLLDAVLSKPVNPSLLLDTVLMVIQNNVSSVALRNRRVEEFDDSMLDPIRGAKILLTEDNEFNQQIALEYLKAGNFYVDLAEDGVQCLDKFEKGEYECILMDIHMPRMDGYMTTKRIREHEKYKGTPIIAMTANVMDEDKQKAVEVGMVDHIPKPVVRSALYATLLKWIPRGEREYVIVDDDSSNEEQILPLPSRLNGCILAKALLNVGGNRTLLFKLLVNFYRDQRNDVYKLRDALENHEYITATTISHTLKSVFGTLGNVNLQTSFAELESGLKNGSKDFDKLISEIGNDFGKFILDLEDWYNLQGEIISNSKPIRNVDVTLAQKKYLELCAKLEGFDPSASDTLQDLIACTNQDEILQDLSELVDNFDFETALQKAKSWKLGN